VGDGDGGTHVEGGRGEARGRLLLGVSSLLVFLSPNLIAFAFAAEYIVLGVAYACAGGATGDDD